MNNYHKSLHLGCRSSPRSVSGSWPLTSVKRISGCLRILPIKLIMSLIYLIGCDSHVQPNTKFWDCPKWCLFVIWEGQSEIDWDSWKWKIRLFLKRVVVLSLSIGLECYFSLSWPGFTKRHRESYSNIFLLVNIKAYKTVKDIHIFLSLKFFHNHTYSYVLKNQLQVYVSKCIASRGFSRADIVFIFHVYLIV